MIISEKFLSAASTSELTEGTVIYGGDSGGESAPGFRFILEGDLIVTRGPDALGRYHEIGQLTKHEFFGEMSLLADDSTHFATVTVRSPTARLIYFDPAAFLEEVRSNHQFCIGLIRVVLQRTERIENQLHRRRQSAVHVLPPLPALRARLCEKNMDLIDYLGKSRLGFAAPGTKFFQTGQADERCVYAIVSGEAVLSFTNDEREYDIMRLVEGDIYGTHVFMNSRPRALAIRAVSEYVRFAFIDRDLFRKTLLLDPALFLNVFQYFSWNLMRLDQIYYELLAAQIEA